MTYVLTILFSNIRSVEKLNKQELEAGTPSSASWHADYSDTSYIFFSGLHLDLNEGDALTIFSQYGIPVHIRLVRDRETGKSKGFGYLKYEDQRSTILAVDNLNGVDVLGRKLRIDHTYFKIPEDEDPTKLEEEMSFDEEIEQKWRTEVEKAKKRAEHEVKRQKMDSKRGDKISRKSEHHEPKTKSLDDLEKEMEDPMAAYLKKRH